MTAIIIIQLVVIVALCFKDDIKQALREHHEA